MQQNTLRVYYFNSLIKIIILLSILIASIKAASIHFNKRFDFSDTSHEAGKFTKAEIKSPNLGEKGSIFWLQRQLIDVVEANG